jgi:hypothetical protein
MIRVDWRRRTVLFATSLASAATAAAHDFIIDGRDIRSNFGIAFRVAQQRFTTAFGDHTGDSQFGGGSELDALYVHNNLVFLYFGITGNLENNGNCILLFIDTDGPTHGANPLYTRNKFSANEPLSGLPRYLTGDPADTDGLHDVTFDAGFAPDWVVGLSGGSPLGGQTASYYLANLTRLGDSVSDPNALEAINHSNEVVGLTVAASGNGDLSTFWPGSVSRGIEVGVDNSNTEGVSGSGGGDLADPNQPPTADKGVEVRVPLCRLGVAPHDLISVLAMVSSPDGYMSNQFLPTDTALVSLGNQGFPPFDFSDLVGDQFVSLELEEELCDGDPFGTLCDTDTNFDCLIDNIDLQLMLDSWAAVDPSPRYDCRVDYNHDGVVENFDLQKILDDWANNCN